MHVQLVMFKSDGSRREFSLTRDRIVIGRTSDAGLRIPLSSVSRKHCEIAIEGGVVKMRDLGSSNGTLHNSVRVKEAVLAAGDHVEVGPVVFTVVIDGVPAEIEPVRSMVEQELVDTSVGMPVETENETLPPEQAASPTSAKVMEPAGRAAAKSPAEVDPLAAAAAKAAAAKPAGPGPGESFSEGATVVDMDDPIAALERLAAAERELADEFSGGEKNKKK
jgi:predicted component of type VI protein secretion system